MKTQKTNGTCAVCSKSFSKTAMKKHLESSGHSARESSGYSVPVGAKLFTILVEGSFFNEYWMYLEVLSPGKKFSYEYDFGSPTRLDLKVVGEREIEDSDSSVLVLARNEPPLLICNSCGKIATYICRQCGFNNEGWVCDDCSSGHECGEEMLLPVVNSPRVGVCGYTGMD